MKHTHILYNPLAGNGSCKQKAEQVALRYAGAKLHDITQIKDYSAFFEQTDETDRVVLCGGDGTLCRFANETKSITIPCKLYYSPAGTGNDFANDIGQKEADEPIEIKSFLKSLPTVTICGKATHFLNGVGYGIDGYCCDVGDRMREKGDTEINYTTIAVLGLLFHYTPTNATVTVDGVAHTYQKVWLAPTMHGRYYGGGMMPTPDQKRNSDDQTLSLMVFHGSGRLKTLTVFPSIFKGKHVKHTDVVDILQGKEITVRFDRPTPLQIDGETVLGVTEYTARIA